jgi:anion-transporting  ArsA/GET3 family ATPase
MANGYSRHVTTHPRGWPPARLHVVTGKGGVGKTTVAAALALTLASHGRRTLLIEVEGRQGLSPLFGETPLTYRERRLRSLPGDGEVWGLAIDAETALLEYLEMFYRLGRAGSALARLGAIEVATTIAPGVRDVLITGKVKEAVTREKRGAPVYDAVVLDAPPTGRVERFLNVTSAVSALAKVGPIRTQSEGVMAVLQSPMTAVHMVTLLEEMPAQEAVESMTALAASGLPLGAVIVNAAHDPRPELQALTLAELEVGLEAAGLAPTSELVARLDSDVHAYRQRLAVTELLTPRLAGLARPVLRLPYLYQGIDLPSLRTLADALRDQGVGTP